MSKKGCQTTPLACALNQHPARAVRVLLREGADRPAPLASSSCQLQIARASPRELSGSFGLLLSAWPKETSLAGTTGARKISGQCRCAGEWWAGGGEQAERMIEVAGDIVRLLHPPPLAHLNLLNYMSSAGKPSLQKGSQEKALAVNALIRLSEKL